MVLRAIRGATQVSVNSSVAIGDGVRELLPAMLKANGLEVDHVISVLMTATPDLTSEFPAVAARKIGLGNVPLLCSVEIDVAQALPRVVRVLMHAHLERSLADVKHIYLRGATVLRKDLAQ